MRIAFVVNNYPPRVGGVETHVHSLARHLALLGHKVTVVTLSDEPKAIREEDGVDVVRLQERWRIGDVLGFPAVGTTRRLAAELSARGIDVVSIHTRFFPMSWVGLRVARRVGVPAVHTEHGSGFVVSPSWVITMGSRVVDETMGRAVLSGADAVVGVSERVVEFVRRLSGRQATVFYNAIESPIARRPASPRVPPESAPNRLAFVGRLVPGKGADLFVDAVAELLARGLPVYAEILGDGPERAAVEQRIGAHGQSDRIRLRGRVAPDEVRRSLSDAILVNPTTLAEGFQTTLLEALAEGGRVVSFDVPGAELLRSQGHDVVIVRDRSVTAIADAVQELIEREATSAPLVGWYWSDRAREYVRILKDAKTPRN